MKPTKYYRVKNVIYYADELGRRTDRIYKALSYINEAKRESRHLQPRLGDGTVRTF